MALKLNFSLTQLEYALAVQRFGNFSEAARHCAVTQPTLSMQLQKLEDGLGVVLFDRSKKPILLTPDGERLIVQMSSVLHEARKIEGLLEDPGAVKGELTVGVIPTVAPYLLPRLLPVVRKRFPELRLKILELQTERILEALDDDGIDLGVLAIPLGIPKLHELSLYWEPFSVLCRKGDELARRKRVDPHALRGEDVWLLEEGHCLRSQVLDVCTVRKKSQAGRAFQFESGSLETLKNLVSTVGGYTLLPALATDHLASNVTLVPFERPVPAREIGFVFRRQHYKQALQNALREAVIECVPEELREARKGALDVLPVER